VWCIDAIRSGGHRKAPHHEGGMRARPLFPHPPVGIVAPGPFPPIHIFKLFQRHPNAALSRHFAVHIPY
jgi:hypothetical protein